MLILKAATSSQDEGGSRGAQLQELKVSFRKIACRGVQGCAEVCRGVRWGCSGDSRVRLQTVLMLMETSDAI